MPDRPGLAYAADFWGEHSKEVEDDEDIQKAMLSFLASETRRERILTKQLARRNISEFSISGATVLHVLAFNGLVKITKFVLLLRANRKDGYVR